MKIKALQCIAGADFVLNVGDETEQFDDAEAIRFIDAGFAIPVAAPKIERAVKAVPETRDPLDHDGNGRKGGSKPRKRG